MRYLISSMVLAVAILIVGGCASTGADGYGGRKRAVTVRAQPEPAAIFVVDNAVWIRQADSLRGDPKALEKYYKGESPAKVYLYPQKTMLIARDAAGNLGVLDYTASEDNDTVIIPIQPTGSAPSRP